MTDARTAALAAAHAPTAADIDALAHAAFTQLPATFRRLCEGLVIQVVDFPDDETLDEMEGRERVRPARPVPRPRPAASSRGRGDRRAAQYDLALSPAAARLLVRGRGHARRGRRPCPRARDRPPFRPLRRRHGGDRGQGGLNVGRRALHKGVTEAIDYGGGRIRADRARRGGERSVF